MSVKCYRHNIIMVWWSFLNLIMPKYWYLLQWMLLLFFCNCGVHQCNTDIMFIFNHYQNLIALFHHIIIFFTFFHNINVDKEDKLSWSRAYHTATSICIVHPFFSTGAHQQCGTVKVPAVSWAGQKPSGLGSVFWVCLVSKNFHLEICDFLFRHMHGALNIIK